jgi:hypothetical protein
VGRRWGGREGDPQQAKRRKTSLEREREGIRVDFTTTFCSISTMKSHEWKRDDG